MHYGIYKPRKSRKFLIFNYLRPKLAYVSISYLDFLCHFIAYISFLFFGLFLVLVKSNFIMIKLNLIKESTAITGPFPFPNVFGSPTLTRKTTKNAWNTKNSGKMMRSAQFNAIRASRNATTCVTTVTRVRFLGR